MDINSEDRIFLKAIFASKESIDIYDIHKEYLLSPGQVSRSLKKLTKLDLVSVDFEAGKALLTENGLIKIVEKRKIFFGSFDREKWRAPPDEMLGEKIEINAPYIPRRMR